MTAAVAPDFEVRLAKTEASLAALGQDVSDLVGVMRGLADKFDASQSKIGAELSKRGQVNWGLIVSIIGAAMAGMAYYGSNLREPIVARQDALSLQIAALQSAVVPRAEVTTLMTQAQRDNDLIRLRIERFENRVEKRLDRLDGTVYVPAWKPRS